VQSETASALDTLLPSALDKAFKRELGMQLIANYGYEYGWSPLRPEESLILTKRPVVSPPPL